MSPSSITEMQSPTVEELVTAFKRRGHFDTLRKATLSSFQGGPEGEKLTANLRDIVRAEVEKDSNLLYRDRSKSSILVGGAVDRAGVLDSVKTDRDAAFEEQRIQDQIKAVITALRVELGQSSASDGQK